MAATANIGYLSIMTINYEGVANIASSDSVDYGLITNPCQGLGSLHAVKACPASSIMAAIVPNAWFGMIRAGYV